MSVKTQKQQTFAIYFSTFTCYRWQHLFEITKFHDFIYRWFDRLKSEGNEIIGYVIMPNHVHLLLFLPENSKGLNHVIKEGKRFMAYEIVKRLKTSSRVDVLEILRDGVNAKEKNAGKKHRVFEESFDAKECLTEKFIWQKLRYMHRNPVSKNGHW